jgi:hypothetical protein
MIEDTIGHDLKTKKARLKEGICNEYNKEMTMLQKDDILHCI